jgi:hypothetical protein
MNNQEIQMRIKKLIHSLLHEKGYVCSVDILMGLNILSKKDHEDWRFGRVDYLERVCKTNWKNRGPPIKSMGKE